VDTQRLLFFDSGLFLTEWKKMTKLIFINSATPHYQSLTQAVGVQKNKDLLDIAVAFGVTV